LRNKSFSRRWFLKSSAVALTGVWSGCSNQLGARAVRGFIAESFRTVHEPKAKPTPASWNCNSITACWLGHSTVLINFYGLNILTDPALGRRIGATTSLGTVGPKRLVAPALTIGELPVIDVVLLSHAHMDHTDLATLRALPGRPFAVSAYATEDLLQNTRLREPVGLRWGEAVQIATDNGAVQIEAFEVKHWGARWRHDTYRGYNGYVVSREGKRFIFGGDTAWCETFRDLRNSGPYEFAIMPIGAYQPWIGSHCTPEQATHMADSAGAKHLLPIHFKTFAFGREGVLEPMSRLEAAIEPDRIGWRDVGETFSSPIA
jgi:L-ascorbate metabolism protein UlaG (beta-lactamase superfamily)